MQFLPVVISLRPIPPHLAGCGALAESRPRRPRDAGHGTDRSGASGAAATARKWPARHSKERAFLYNGAQLRSSDHLPTETHSVAPIRVLPSCSNCGTKPSALRSRAGCFGIYRNVGNTVRLHGRCLMDPTIHCYMRSDPPSYPSRTRSRSRRNRLHPATYRESCKAVTSA